MNPRLVASVARSEPEWLHATPPGGCQGYLLVFGYSIGLSCFLALTRRLLVAHLAAVVVPQDLHLPQGAAQSPRECRILLGGNVGIPPFSPTWGVLRQGLRTCRAMEQG